MKLNAVRRETTGTSASKKARREGMIPVALYGKKSQTESLLVNRRDFEVLLKEEGSNAVFQLVLDGKEQKVWIKDFQKAALKNDFYSIDLQAISANQTLEVEVPLSLVNVDSVKVGIVEHVMTTLLVETKPDSIPHAIEVDVTGLEIGSTISVGELTIPEGVKVLVEPDHIVVSVIVPTEEPAEDATEAEPALVGQEGKAKA